jgi:hypothetical protein
VESCNGEKQSKLGTAAMFRRGRESMKKEKANFEKSYPEPGKVPLAEKAKAY